MIQEEVIEMARDAWKEAGEGWVDKNWFEDRAKALKAFAKLVDAKATAKEREAIKALAEKELLNTAALMTMPPQSSAAWNILQAIRARGEA